MGFPDGFWWGTASSSTQCEGAAPHSDWREWEQDGRAPPSGNGNDFTTRYAEDFALLARHHLTHHRLSLEWARLEPQEGCHDPAAVEHYRRVLQAAGHAGISVWVCLHHFTSPAWFAELGGFLEPTVARDRWRRHVDFVADTFGDLVFGWKPINEPGWYALSAYLNGEIPPGRRNSDDYETVCHEIHRANHDAAKRLRGAGQPIATIHGLAPLYASDPSPQTADALARVDHDVWGAWLEVLRNPDNVDDFDLIGFSYYSAAAIGPRGERGVWPPEGKPGLMGNVAWAGGLAEVLHRLAHEVPDKPLLVSECGMGADDHERVEYLTSALAIVGEAIDEGIDVRGFFHWTSIDNYEWLYGFGVPFGLFDRDRTPKESVVLLAGLAGPTAASG